LIGFGYTLELALLLAVLLSAPPKLIAATNTDNFLPQADCPLLLEGQIYPTYLNPGTIEYTQYFNTITREQIDHGECGPADHDPAGHWHDYEGMLLGLRAQTNLYVRGQLMPVRCTLRNTTTNRFDRIDIDSGAEITFSALNDQGKEVALRFAPGVTGITRYFPIAPHRQKVRTKDLSADFDFTPGKYTVRAHTVGVLYKAGQQPQLLKMDSGPLEIHVVERGN